MLKRLMLLLVLISRSVLLYARAFAPPVALRLVTPFVLRLVQPLAGGIFVMLSPFRLAAGYLYCPRLLPHAAPGMVQFSLVKPFNTSQS